MSVTVISIAAQFHQEKQSERGCGRTREFGSMIELK